MRNVTHYLLDLKRQLRTGERIDGPGESQLSWVIESRDTSMTGPPRRVIRLSPESEAVAIRACLRTAGQA